MIKIEQLFIYPVKSLAGISVQRAIATEQGSGDRQWMIVDSHYNFVTQRQNSFLATIQTSFPTFDKVQRGLSNKTLTLTAPGMGSIDVGATDELREVQVWQSHCRAYVASQETNKWLTDASKSTKPLLLVQFAQTYHRHIDKQRFGTGTTYFADAAPYLITNKDSLAKLNKLLTEERKPVADIRQFRPNIVVSGMQAFKEHSIPRLTHNNGIEINLCDHCQRCSVITIDQINGNKLGSQSPFKTLAKLNAMPDKPRAPAFGVNSILVKGAGEPLKVGDKLSLT